MIGGEAVDIVDGNVSFVPTKTIEEQVNHFLINNPDYAYVDLIPMSSGNVVNMEYATLVVIKTPSPIEIAFDAMNDLSDEERLKVMEKYDSNVGCHVDNMK